MNGSFFLVFFSFYVTSLSSDLASFRVTHSARLARFFFLFAFHSYLFADKLRVSVMSVFFYITVVIKIIRLKSFLYVFIALEKSFLPIFHFQNK